MKYFLLIVFLLLGGCATVKHKCFYCNTKQECLNYVQITLQKSVRICDKCHSEYRGDNVLMWHLMKQCKKYKSKKGASR
jgi:hypothetical protein